MQQQETLVFRKSSFGTATTCVLYGPGKEARLDEISIEKAPEFSPRSHTSTRAFPCVNQPRSNVDYPHHLVPILNK